MMTWLSRVLKTRPPKYGTLARGTCEACIYMPTLLFVLYYFYSHCDVVPRVTTLVGHKMAVTSVDWKCIGDKSFIATCADDQASGNMCGKIFSIF